MKKGFTLIELLAVIIILAIIALIATPIVLSIINDSKESAVIRSAEFYTDAVENKIMQENMKQGGTLSPEECTIGTDGNVTCDGTPLEIEVNGEKPTSGSITFDKGKVTNIILTFGENTVSMDTNGELVLGDSASICTLISDSDDSGTITPGDKYQCKVKDDMEAAFKDGYYFYVLSQESDGTTNLIMDRNICEDGTVATAENTCLVAWITDLDCGCEEPSCADSFKGPVTAMNYLNNATSSWSSILNLNITYDDEGGSFTEFEVTGKARLPYKSEVNDYNENNLFLYNYLDDDGYQENTIEGIYGYWTFYSVVGDFSRANFINFSGTISSNYVNQSNYYGVRPVINVKL